MRGGEKGLRLGADGFCDPWGKGVKRLVTKRARFPRDQGAPRLPAKSDIDAKSDDWGSSR